MKRFVKIFASAIVLILCAFIIFRCWLSTATFMVNDIYPSDSMVSAASQVSDDELCVKVKVSDEISHLGYFKCYALIYSDSANEAQASVRWNDSIVDYTDMSADTEFVFTLNDVTTGQSWESKTVDSDEMFMYNYRRVIFENVNISEGDELTMTMLLRDGYTDEMKLKYAEQEFVNYKLNKSEKISLGYSD